MYYLKKIAFVEQPSFTRMLTDLVDDDTYRRFRNELAANPEKGPIVKGSGGARILYLWFPRHDTIVFYLVYTKGEMEGVPAAQMKAIKYEVQRIKNAFGEGD